MKRRDWFRLRVKSGCCLKRHGANHDIYQNTKNHRLALIPRHNEIRDSLCELIKKQLGVESPR